MSRPAPLVVALLGLALLAASCGKREATTLLVVDITSDLGDRMDRVVLLVDPPGDGPPRTLEFPLTGVGGVQLPIRAALIPGEGHESGPVGLTARALKGTTLVTQQQLETSFQPGKRLLVQMTLVVSCLSNACPASQACAVGGACIPRRVNGVDFDPSRPPAGLDAGSDGRPGSDGQGSDGATIDGPITDGPGSDRPIDAPGLDGTGTDGPARPDTGDDGGCDCPSDDNPCTTDTCEAGVCKHNPLPDRMACPGGVCVAGKCTCGGAGEVCCVAAPICQGGLACQNGTCGACGAERQSCCAGNTCAAGLLCAGGSCARCGGVGQPCCADGSCGAGGMCNATTKMCQPCGGAGQTCCPTGAACGANLGCAAGVCTCGGFGQPCCAAGTACTDDRNACNGTEVCQAGRCARANAVTCAAKSQCHMVGVCDPTTGRCSEPLRPDSSVCNDGNPCSSGDNCQSGSCVPRQATCDDFRPCTANTCTPTGCSFPNLPMGTLCGGNNQCQTAVCGNAGNCVITSRDGLACMQASGGQGRCSGDVCCPILSPNCG